METETLVDTPFAYEEVALEPTPTVIPLDTAPPLGDFEYSCETCGIELAYGGRGRKPTRCKEHKKSGTTRGAGPTVNRTARWQQPLAEALNAQFMGIGMVAMAFNQFDGQVIMQGAPRLSQALVAVAETNPSVRKGLETFVTAGAWSQVLAAVATIALPIAMNHKLIPQMAMPGIV